MTPKLTDEMRHALRSHPDGPVEIEDAETRQVYVLVAKESFRELIHEELLRELQVGFDQADAGRLSDWDPEEIKAEGRRRQHPAELA
jgi:hypothetical protein